MRNIDLMTHGILVIAKKEEEAYESGQDVGMLHFAFYPSEPSEDDMHSLRTELEADPDFRIDVPFVLKHAPKRLVDTIRNEIKNADTK